MISNRDHGSNNQDQLKEISRIKRRMKLKLRVHLDMLRGFGLGFQTTSYRADFGSLAIITQKLVQVEK